jgi:hypothetical protein
MCRPTISGFGCGAEVCEVVHHGQPLRDKESAIHQAMEEFRIEPARRFHLIAEPIRRT